MNICIFLTTRYGSTRLPGKHLLKIGDKTVTDILIGRLKLTGLPLIMCTPDTPEDTKYMYEIASRNNIHHYAGEITNILKRHCDCAEMYGIDWVINVDGDDILTCPEVITDVRRDIKHFEDGYGTIITEGNPLGLNVLAYKSSILKGLQHGDTNWGKVIRDTPRRLTHYYRDNSKYRLTLDYTEDFDVIKDVLTNCKNNCTVDGICQYLKEHPEIAGLNQFRNVEYWQRISRGG